MSNKTFKTSVTNATGTFFFDNGGQALNLVGDMCPFVYVSYALHRLGGGGYSLHIPHNNNKFTSSCDRYVLLYPFDFQIWLIEINVNPALHTNCQVLRDMLPSMVDETLSKSHDPDSSLSLIIFVMIFFSLPCCSFPFGVP